MHTRVLAPRWLHGPVVDLVRHVHQHPRLQDKRRACFPVSERRSSRFRSLRRTHARTPHVGPQHAWRHQRRLKRTSYAWLLCYGSVAALAFGLNWRTRSAKSLILGSLHAAGLPGCRPVSVLAMFGPSSGGGAGCVGVEEAVVAVVAASAVRDVLCCVRVCVRVCALGAGRGGWGGGV